MTIINLDGVVGWDIVPADIARALDEAEGDVTFEMNSPGGYITDGMAIMNKIKSYDKGSTTANITYAASMMTQIASACDNVNCYENAIYMIHNAQGGGYGDDEVLMKASNRLRSFNHMLANNYVNQSGISKDDILEMMKDETYLFGQEIVDKGFASQTIDTKSEIDEESAKALAHDMFMNCIGKMKEKEEDTEAVSAILSDFDKISMQNNEINEKDDIIVGNQNKNEGDLMEKEFDQNDVNTAVTDSNAVVLTDERSRVSAIMAVDCSNELKTEAIEGGSTAGDLALKVLVAQKDVKVAAKSNFEQASLTADVDVAEPKKDLSDEAKKLEEAEKALDSIK